VKALAHPLRVKLLAALNQKVASPSELAEELDEPLGNVSYHVRNLADLGCIELVGTTPRRGALEHHYRATVRPYFTDELWRQIPESIRQSITGESLEYVFREAGEAVANGDFDARDSRHMSRTPLVLDEQGWNEVAELLNEALDRALQIQGEAASRLAEEGAESVASRMVIMHYAVSAASGEGQKPAPAKRRKRAKASR
jgi:DNA-binding transcriptional ArsR family regulator